MTAVVDSGASVKVAQDLARHSDPKLTIGRYAHARLRDLAAAVPAVPGVRGNPGQEAQTAALRPTGTETASARAAHMQHIGRDSVQSGATESENDDDRRCRSGNPKPLSRRDKASLCEMKRGETKTRVTGLEPATSGSTVRCSNQLSYTPKGRFRNLIVTLATLGSLNTVSSNQADRAGDTALAMLIALLRDETAFS